MDADAQAQAPTTADLNDGVDSRPEADLTIQSQPAEGGDQMADNSTATIQVGGGGRQTATDSTGTVQVAEPGLTTDGSAQAPGGADPNDGIAADPQADITAQLTPAHGGDQLADNSTATIQVGGGGQQTATDSTGTVQVAEPGPERELAAVQSPAPAPPGEQAPTPEAEASPAPGPPVLGARTIRGPAQPSRPAALGAETEQPLIQPRLETLPFTGLLLWVSVLLGAALLLAGLGLRRRWMPGLTT
jgi:hypothetical protein